MTTGASMRVMAAMAAAMLVAGCGDSGAREKAKADAAAAESAERKAQYDAQMAERRVSSAVECHAAIRWRGEVLPRIGLGDASEYLAFYREQVANAVKDTTIPAAPPTPELSAANVDAYLAWSDKHIAETELETGNGAATMRGCVSRASEMGAGTLAGESPFERNRYMLALDRALAL